MSFSPISPPSFSTVPLPKSVLGRGRVMLSDFGTDYVEADRLGETDRLFQQRFDRTRRNFL